MHRICVLLFGVAGGLFAQEPTPAIQRAIKDLVSQHAFPEHRPTLSASTPKQVARLILPGPTLPKSVCSVPLLSARIPEDVNFVIQRIRPTHHFDPMPQVTGAPPCPDR